MQAIKESANQTAALVQEESKRQTAESAKHTTALHEEAKMQTAALLKAESAKLTSAVESLSSKIRKENENLAKKSYRKV